MTFKTFLNDINLNKNDKKYLILLFCFSVILTISMIRFNHIKYEFNGDVYRYLAGTLSLAGINSRIADPYWIQNSPVIIFLTSLLFRLGFVDINSIFIVTGIFGIFGIFGMYTFLKIRFSALLSFTGTILYSSLSLTLYYFANGMLDMPAVAMFIWTLIFTVVAVNKNPKYYVLVAISFAITFFIRFTSAYLIILVVLYMFKNHDFVNLCECLFYNKEIFKERIFNFIKSQEFKWIFISTIIGLIIFLTVFLLLLSYYPSLTYFEMAKGSLNRHDSLVEPVYNVDSLFFVKNFLNLLSCDSITYNIVNVEEFNNPTSFAYLIITILIGGILLKFINFIKNLKFFQNHKKELKFRNKTSKLYLIVLLYVILIFALIGFEFNYIITLLCLCLVFIILMSLIREYPINRDNFVLSLLCFAIFSFYMIIFSFIYLKCIRYILPSFPGFIYFVIYALDYIIEFLNGGFDDEKALFEKLNKVDNSWVNISKSNLKTKLITSIPIVLIVICLLFTFNFSSTVDINKDNLSKDILCNFIKEYDPDYQSKEFYYHFRDFKAFEWILNKKIKNGGDVKEFVPEDYEYIIVFEKPVKYDNFREIYHINMFYLYEKTT